MLLLLPRATKPVSDFLRTSGQEVGNTIAIVKDYHIKKMKTSKQHFTYLVEVLSMSMAEMFSLHELKPPLM